ncbi:MAG TPA: dihydrofolate reductase family protein [Candidatus Eisenbacteria bacterium]|nr:dihydrofolate reductase family protein [Candidatus Eisenbacteria bacterium]
MLSEAKSTSGGRKLFLFMMVSLDGYIEGPNHDLSWHNVDSEFNDYAIEQTKNVGTLLFGHTTYDVMKDYWPTVNAREDDPVVANLMNTTPKIVFSRSLEKVEETEYWKNVRLMKDVVTEEIQKLKEESSKDIAVYGSNNLCVTLLEMGLLDELRIMVNPVVIGSGTPLFKGIKSKLSLQLLGTKEFKNGNVLLIYKPQE